MIILPCAAACSMTVTIMSSVCDEVYCGWTTHLIVKVSEQVNRKGPVGSWFYNFQSPTSLHRVIDSLSTLVTNFTYLLYLAFLITWPFCLCAMNKGQFCYRGDYKFMSYTTGLFVGICYGVKADFLSRRYAGNKKSTSNTSLDKTLDCTVVVCQPL